MKNWTRIAIVLLVIVSVNYLVKYLGYDKLLTFESLQSNKDNLSNFVKANYIYTVLVYIGIYFITTALMLPGGGILSLTGGVLFGPVRATIFINVGATLGAIVSFFISRYLVGDWAQKKFESQLKKFNQEIDRHGSNYLLTLRFVPLFPFFLINIASGLTKIKPLKFLWTTMFLIIPVSYAYAL
ncbi:MAG: VTT domain-containing protein [Acidaminobacteraceae bacterium]